MGCSNENRPLRKPKHNKENNSFSGPKSPLTAFLGITLDKFSVRAQNIVLILRQVNSYHQLLSATVDHLEREQERGQRRVIVDPAKLNALFQPLAATPSQSAETSSVLAAMPDSNTLAELRDQALTCTRCPHLVTSRKQVVFGVGSETADLMFVGEAPGADEDAQGEPFVGKAGQLLTKIIQTMGLSRDEVYIANILKCRPDTPQRSGNRPPTAEEMTTCSPWLHRQIDLINPKLIVALGKTAVEGLLEQQVAITRFRGTWQTYRGISLMPTFHPAYLLHQQSLTSKRKVWEDMLAVMEKLSMPISDKQRGFFLPR